MLIGSAMKKRAKKQAETLLQRAEGQDLEFLLRENKTNFKVYIPEIAEAVVEPPSFLAMHGKQTGSWNLNCVTAKNSDSSSRIPRPCKLRWPCYPDR
jgi:hypothetical protein